MKKINLEYIKSLNPCQNRLNNYIEHYSDFEGTLEQFLRLKKITQADKEWVYFRSVSKETARLVACDIAESVLHIFEDKFPNDDRPRKAIEAARDAEDARDARAAAEDARAAAWAAAGADWAAAWAAAWDAAWAARAAARAAGAARDAAKSTVTTDWAADWAVRAADWATRAAGRANQEKVNLRIMKKYLKGKN